MRQNFIRANLCLSMTLAITLLTLPGCTSISANPDDDRLKIVATVGMIADIVRHIAGERATVHTIIGEGVDPHLYKPTRNDVVAMLGADIVFYNGLHLEGKMGDVLGKVGRRQPVLPVSDSLGESYLLNRDGASDPHVWMDAAAWSHAAEVITDFLCAHDPDGAPEYRHRAAFYQQKLNALHQFALTAIGSIPESRRVLITAHDAFSYFGRAYHLEVMGIQGLSTQSEAGLHDINQLVDFIVKRDIPAVFVETSVSDKNIRALIEGAAARGHALRIGGHLYSDAMGARGTFEGTYCGMIHHNITTITNALGGTNPETPAILHSTELPESPPSSP